MMGSNTEGTSAEEWIRAELRALRAQVVGIHGSMVATTDGFVVAHDVADMEPTQIAAIIATTLGLARQTTQATGRGHFREAVARGSDGYLVVYAVGDVFVMAVIGTNELNVGMLHYQTRDLIRLIVSHSPGLGQRNNGLDLLDGSFTRG